VNEGRNNEVSDGEELSLEDSNKEGDDNKDIKKKGTTDELKGLGINIEGNGENVRVNRIVEESKKKPGA
jgi:hypothetical protein